MPAPEAPAWFFTKALSHRQKVLRLYKRSQREIGSWYAEDDLLEMRYHSVVLRARFEQHKNERDLRKAQKLLMDGCRELWEKRHPTPFAYCHDPYGVAYDRQENYSDLILDTHWSYVEMEQFPYYFNRREKRKRELLEHWDKIQEDWDKELSAMQKEVPPEPEPSETPVAAKH